MDSYENYYGMLQNPLRASFYVHANRRMVTGISAHVPKHSYLKIQELDVSLAIKRSNVFQYSLYWRITVNITMMNSQLISVSMCTRLLTISRTSTTSAQIQFLPGLHFPHSPSSVFR